MNIVLVDTNVLVYAHDLGEFDKQLRAIQVLQYLQTAESGYLSVQCLAEFINITTRGRNPMLSVADATRQVEKFIQSWIVLDLTPQIVLEALRGVRDHQMHYYDAQIWAMAKLNQIPIILTEDIPSAGTIEGVRFVNPFAADFVVEDWA